MKFSFHKKGKFHMHSLFHMNAGAHKQWIHHMKHEFLMNKKYQNLHSCFISVRMARALKVVVARAR